MTKEIGQIKLHNFNISTKIGLKGAGAMRLGKARIYFTDHFENNTFIRIYKVWYQSRCFESVIYKR